MRIFIFHGVSVPITTKPVTPRSIYSRECNYSTRYRVAINGIPAEGWKSGRRRYKASDRRIDVNHEIIQRILVMEEIGIIFCRRARITLHTKLLVG